MKDNILEIDFPKLGTLLLPMPLRRYGIVGVIHALMNAPAQLLQNLQQHRKDTLTRLKYNAQVCRMELCLNNLFNPDNIDHIRVVDSQQNIADPFFLYHRGTAVSIDMPLRINAPGRHIILNDRAHNSQTRYDFYVYIPQSIPINETVVRTVVNKMKVPGKIWQLVRT
jgi:hypothetical protein